MEQRFIDWKDIASSFYDKCLAVTILLMFFTFVVFPNVETQVIKSKEKVVESIEILNEIKEDIKPPAEVAKPMVNFEIIEGDEEGSEDVKVIDTIESTNLKAEEIVIAPTNSQDGQTSRFVQYDESPVATRLVQPEYPDFAKKSKIQGTVVLDVEILADGSVGAIEVRKSLFPGTGGLDEAAIKSVRATKFQPARSNGKAVAVWVTYPITFSLEN